MRRFLCLFFCALFALSLTTPTAAKRKFGGGSRHSYPSSSGLSGGGGRHSYPSSGGLSGSGHGYPSSGGSHAYPSSGGSHGYPSSGGLSGNSHGAPGSGGYPSSGGSGYPSNTHHSSSHGYPAGKGLSGNANTGHTTNVHYHYNYNPPQQIRYAPVHGGPPVSYPVYHGSPPTYVYKYKDSGTKYGTLIAGLALLNLGTVAAGAYALSHNHQSYKPQPGEICKFGVRKDNGDYEETKIDCQLITSFIFQEEAKTHQNSPSNATIITTTVTNVTTVNITNPGTGEEVTSTTVKPLYEMLPNGTFVPVNGTAVNTTTTNTTNDAAAPSTGNTMTSSVTVTTTNTTTVANALDVKGKPVEVTPVMISVCWVAGAGVGFLPLFGWHKVSPDFPPGCYFVEVMDYNYLLFLYFATIVTPSVLLAAFYAHIYRVVIKQMSAVVTVEGSQGRGGTMLRVLGAAQKREVKATQNLAIIVFFFIICWIPLYTMNAIKTFMPELDIPNTLTYFCIIFSHLNSAINPLLYAYHLKDFRAALKGLICTIFGRAVPIPAAYRPPIPVRRPALERCNALRPKVYVNSPVWLRQREAEMAAKAAKEKKLALTSIPDAEPFLGRIAADGSSGRHSPEGRETNGPYLIESSQEKCQSPYKKVEDFLRRVRSVHSDHS